MTATGYGTRPARRGCRPRCSRRWTGSRPRSRCAAPPPLSEAATAAGCPRDGVRALEAAGRIVRLEDDLAWAATTYRELVTRAISMAAAAPLTPAAFRDETGTSRRYVLVILEDLDRRGLLRRTDAGHVLGPKTIAKLQARAAARTGRRRRERRSSHSPIVLAGGASSRFGSDKLAAPLDGRPLLHHALDAVAAVADHVIVVVGPGQAGPRRCPHR